MKINSIFTPKIVPPMHVHSSDTNSTFGNAKQSIFRSQVEGQFRNSDCEQQQLSPVNSKFDQSLKIKEQDEIIERLSRQVEELEQQLDKNFKNKEYNQIQYDIDQKLQQLSEQQDEKINKIYNYVKSNNSLETYSKDESLMQIQKENQILKEKLQLQSQEIIFLNQSIQQLSTQQANINLQKELSQQSMKFTKQECLDCLELNDFKEKYQILKQEVIFLREQVEYQRQILLKEVKKSIFEESEATTKKEQIYFEKPIEDSFGLKKIDEFHDNMNNQSLTFNKQSSIHSRQSDSPEQNNKLLKIFQKYQNL